MAVNITSTSFSGKYGSDNDIGDIIHIHMEVEPGDIWSMNKEITFLIDVSGSMEGSMKKLRSSLLAFRDSIVGKSHLEMETLTPSERDQLIRNTVRIRIITFSNDAKEVWTNESEETFESVVLGLSSEAMTNMGDALKLAFDKTDSNMFTWIIAMTDGESNEGPCRTSSSFHRLVTSSKPLNSKIVSLGYGDRFDPEVLNRIGTFVYVEDAEMIPVVLGNLAEEIMTSVAFNCVVDIPGSSLVTEINEDTIIVPAGEDDTIQGKIIVGNRVIGPLCNGKEYDYVFLPHGNNCSNSLLEGYTQVNIRFTDIITDNEVDVHYPIVHSTDAPPDYIRDMFFDSEKKRLIYRLYQVLQKYSHRKVKKEIQIIGNIIAEWKDEVSERHKDELIKLLKDIKNRSKGCSNTALNYAVGSGYTEMGYGNNGNHRNMNYASSTLTGTQHYMESPLINNNNN